MDTHHCVDDRDRRFQHRDRTGNFAPDEEETGIPISDYGIITIFRERMKHPLPKD
jgi:hypothetical protein